MVLSPPVLALQISPRAPPMVKQIAFSSSGGVGAEPTVNSAKSAQSSTATKPMAVARRRVMAQAHPPPE